MQKIMILGGNGFLGQNLGQYALSQNDEVYSFDRRLPEKKNDGINYIEGDFFNDDTLFSTLEQMDVIYDAICTINPGNSEELYKKAYEEEFPQHIKLISWISEHNKKLVFLSSGGTVYGVQEKQPIGEDCPTKPINHYGSLKLCIENVIKTFNVNSDNKMRIARISNPYGCGQDFRGGVGFIDATLKSAISGKELVVYGDGSIVRDYIYIDDVARLLYSLSLYDGCEEVFNISTGVGTAQNEVIDIVKHIYPDLKIKYIEPRKVDLQKVILDNSKITNEFPGDLVKLEDGIGRYSSFLKSMK